MNIIVQPYGSDSCYCRPDTTWERENRDFYVPEGIGEVHWAPVVFVRISKAGKCIGEKFAERYYDAFNFGALLYCQPEQSEGSFPIAFSSCIDHTSLLPSPTHNLSELENTESVFIVTRNAEEIFKSESEITEKIRNAVCRASKLTSLRIGDYLAVELAPSTIFAAHGEDESALKATFGTDETINIKVIF